MNYEIEKRVKIAFAASSGGHFEQLMMFKPMMEKYNCFIVTEKTDYAAKTPVKTYYVSQVNRKELLFPFKMIGICFKSLGIVLKERPDFIICTGVLAMIPMCLLTKMFGGKLIYLESFAKVTSPTVSGKFLYKKADRFYVQWESMKEIYPNAIYKGGIY